MKTFVLSLLMLLTLPALATTWYVRPDGGSRFSPDNRHGQCNGKADAAYPGNGNNRNCAFDDPRYLYSTGGNQPYSWIISGGDTVIMRGGPYRIGGSTSAACPAFSNGCASDNSFIPAPPPGTTAQPTRILGENYASCSAKTQLYGGYTVNAVFDLRGTHDVQVECFDMTDHSQCSVMGDRRPASCTGTLADDLAKSGILTDDNTHDITLQDLDIHGFRSNGISGPVGGVVNATRVRIAFNGSAGWNFDDGLGHHSINGQMNWSSVTLEGNGCIEEYPITHAFPAVACYDDGNGGYGDAVGTNDDQINFNVDHSTFRYNTQDGLDLLHDRGANITITNSSFYGNMGQQLKLGPMASTVVRNNLFLTNCKRLAADMPGAPAGYNAELSDFCRASAAVIMVQRGDNAGGGSYLFQNNSFVGYTGDAMLETGECTDSFVSALTNDCKTPNIVYQNNLMVGYPYPINAYRYTGLPPSGLGTESGAQSRFAARDHNIYYNTYSCPQEPGSSCTDPHLAGEPVFTGNTPLDEKVFDGVNFALTSASTNAIGQGINIPGLTTDFNGTPRTGAGTIGALVFGGVASPLIPPSNPSTLTPQFSFAVTPNPLAAGKQAVMSLTAPPVDGLLPTGTVTFFISGSPVQASLVSGTASVTTPGMSAGTYTLSASYSGDSNFAAVSAGGSTLTVDPAPDQRRHFCCRAPVRVQPDPRIDAPAVCDRHQRHDPAGAVERAARVGDALLGDRSMGRCHGSGQGQLVPVREERHQLGHAVHRGGAGCRRFVAGLRPHSECLQPRGADQRCSRIPDALQRAVRRSAEPGCRQHGHGGALEPRRPTAWWRWASAGYRLARHSLRSHTGWALSRDRNQRGRWQPDCHRDPVRHG